MAVAFPSYAYDKKQRPPLIVLTQTALAALGPDYATIPFSPPDAPADPGFVVTGMRLQQLLVEARVRNALLAGSYRNQDDPVALRADVLATDSSLMGVIGGGPFSGFVAVSSLIMSALLGLAVLGASGFLSVLLTVIPS